MNRKRRTAWLAALSIVLLSIAGVSWSKVQELHPVDYFAVNCAHISNWDWLRTPGAETTWMFRADPGDRMAYGAFLMINALVTQGASGGAGYSTPIVLEAWSTSMQKYRLLVLLDNPFPFEDPANSQGVGYMTHATVRLPLGLRREFRQTGELTVEYAWNAFPLNYHVAVNNDCMKIVY